MPQRFRFTQAKKRALFTFVEPIIRLAFAAFVFLSGDRWRNHRFDRLPADGLRILVVRLDTIGDVLLSEPALRALRARYPRSTIDVITSPAGAAVIGDSPAIDRIIPYQAPWHAAWRGQRIGLPDISGIVKIVRELRARRYDLGFELRSDPRDIALLALSGTGVKIGDSWRGGGWMLDIDAKAPVEAHRVEFSLAIVAASGAQLAETTAERRPRLVLRHEDRLAADRVLEPLEGRRFLVFHLGAGFASKCLPIDRFARIAQSFGKTHAIVVVGGADERPLVEQLARESPVPILDLVGALKMRETAAVIERADLFIGNDSGPMHLAAAVGRPIVTFFGPSEPHKYRPYGVPQRLIEIDLFCRPCDHVHCVHREFLCMTRIPVTEIVQAADDLLRMDEPVIAGSRSVTME